MPPRAALFLDRDGTIIEDPGYLSDPDKVVILPGVAQALRTAFEHYHLFLFTNQSGIGRGYYTTREADACNARMCELLDLPSPAFSDIKIAPEAPDQPSLYRKPSPRYILEMLQKHDLDPQLCWMVGDKLSDVHSGLDAGIRAALIAPAPPAGLPVGVPVASSLPAFIRDLLP